MTKWFTYIEKEACSDFPSVFVLMSTNGKKNPESLLHKAKKTYTCPFFSFDVTTVVGGRRGTDAMTL